MSYTVIETKQTFDGLVFDVRVDTVKISSGAVRQIDVVEHGGSVALVPVDKDGSILFVDQYRHPAGKRVLELPAGTLEAGEDPQACASRECREEVGKLPGRLRRLGGFFLAPGYSTEYMHVFLATELEDAPLPGDEDEDLRVVRLTPAAALEHMSASEVEDAKSLAAMLLALPALGIHP